MCGRFAQYEPRSHYIEALNPGSVWETENIVR